MPEPIAGLNGIYGYIVQEPETPPEDIHGGVADPFHAQYGEVAEPYPWQMQQYGPGPYTPVDPIDAMIGMYAEVLLAGTIDQDPTGDQTPYTHAAPFPKNPVGDGSVSPENTAQQLQQNRSIHASNLGSSYKHLYNPTAVANNDTWEEVWAVSPGTSSLQQPGTPQQVAIAVGGFGSRDRGNTVAAQNGYGFDSAHMHRRFATGAIPGNAMNLRPGGRALVKSFSPIAYRNFPTGADTPFYGDDTSQSFDTVGAVLVDTPSEYISPPQPNTVAGPGSDPSDLGAPTSFGVDVW